MHLSYVRYILEYSSLVWDGCSLSCSDSIEKLTLYHTISTFNDPLLEAF